MTIMVKVRLLYKDGHYETREIDPFTITDLVNADEDIIKWEVIKG